MYGVRNFFKSTYFSGLRQFNTLESRQPCRTYFLNRSILDKSAVIKNRNLLGSTVDIFQDQIGNSQIVTRLNKLVKETETQNENEEIIKDSPMTEKPLTPKERRKLKAQYYRDTKLYRELKKVMLTAIEKKDIATLWRLYPAVLKDKKVDPRVLKDVKYSVWFWDQMIKVCSFYGYVKKAFKFYNVMKKIGLTPKKSTLFWLLQTCAKGRSRDRKGGFVDYCFKILEEMKKFEVKPNLHAFNLILQTCANARDTESAKKILYMMKSGKVLPDQSTFSSLMSCFDPDDEDVARNDTEADNELHEVDSVESIKEEEKEKEKERLQRVFSFWNQMIDDLKLRPDLRAVNTLLRILRNSSQPLKALEWFNENSAGWKDKYNLVPDHRTYDILLSACLKAKKFLLAKELIEQKIIPNSHLFLADVVLCNTMLRITARLDRQSFHNVLQFMEREKVNFDQQSYEIMIGAYGRFGDINKAFALFQEMDQRGLKQNRAVFTSLLYAVCEVTDNDKFRYCWETMKQKQITPDSVLKRLFTTTCQLLNEPEILKEFQEYVNAHEITKKEYEENDGAPEETTEKQNHVKERRVVKRTRAHSKKTSSERFNAFV